jgi:FixJ family two-component response regulator
MAKNHGPSEPAPDVPLVAIVDDDASVRHSTYRLVRSFGYRAETYGSGEEFLTSGAAPQTACLLLDVRMPGMDGLEVQRLLAERGECVPVVFLTAQASDDEERRARSAGAVEVLRKPVGQASLRRVLENVALPRSGGRGNRDGE